MSPFGSYDMAGNVKEWTANPSTDERYVLGGGWDEPRYAFSAGRPAAALPRKHSRLPDDQTCRSAAGRDLRSGADVTEKLHEPAGDVEYRVFESLHRYESSPLDARTERVVETSPHWRRETLSFRAAYGNERVLAHLFLPRNASPPYQIVLVLGGSTIVTLSGGSKTSTIPSSSSSGPGGPSSFPC